MIRLLVALLAVMCIAWMGAGCGSGEDTPPPATKTPPAPQPDPPPPAEEAPAAPQAPAVAEASEPEATAVRETITCEVRVVDLAGKPLPRMAPILSRTPNALDEPLAIGGPTTAEGLGQVRAEVEGTVFARAWDPELDHYPNNFYEIVVGSGQIAKDMVITMVPASNLAVRFLLPDGRPATDEIVELMLVHPSRGPWWPAATTTNFNGLAIYEKVPPGTFSLRFSLESGASVEVPATELPPAGLAQLGDLQLR